MAETPRDSFEGDVQGFAAVGGFDRRSGWGRYHRQDDPAVEVWRDRGVFWDVSGFFDGVRVTDSLFLLLPLSFPARKLWTQACTASDPVHDARRHEEHRAQG